MTNRLSSALYFWKLKVGLSPWQRKLRKANEENAYLLCYSKHLGYLFEEIERRGYPVKQRKSYKSLIVPPRSAHLQSEITSAFS